MDESWKTMAGTAWLEEVCNVVGALILLRG